MAVVSNERLLIDDDSDLHPSGIYDHRYLYRSGACGYNDQNSYFDHHENNRDYHNIDHNGDDNGNLYASSGNDTHAKSFSGGIYRDMDRAKTRLIDDNGRVVFRHRSKRRSPWLVYCLRYQLHRDLDRAGRFRRESLRRRHRQGSRDDQRVDLERKDIRVR